jgi:hypothetical protein
MKNTKSLHLEIAANVINTVACRPVARQQIHNTHQWINYEEMFCTQSVRQLRDATIELLKAAFSMLYMPRCFKQNKSTI